MPNIKCGFFTNCLTAHPLEKECFVLEALGPAAPRAGRGPEVTNKDTSGQTSWEVVLDSTCVNGYLYLPSHVEENIFLAHGSQDSWVLVRISSTHPCPWAQAGELVNKCKGKHETDGSASSSVTWLTHSRWYASTSWLGSTGTGHRAAPAERRWDEENGRASVALI